MTIHIPDDLARGMEGIAASQQKSVEQLAIDSLRAHFANASSPEILLGAVRKLPHPSAAAVDDLEAAIAAARLPVRDQGVRSVVERDGDRPRNRLGAKAKGAYPTVSRTKMAKLTGLHISTVTGILKGRQRPALRVALVMAKAIGVEIEELERELGKWQRKAKAEKAR